MTNQSQLVTLPSRPGPERVIMPGAEPIFFDQGKEAILFLHGFTGSTYEGREFALHFVQKGYACWVPLLPGHGTSPEDLNGIEYEQWLEAAEAYYLELKKHYDRVYVCGQSMGGALALHLAANFEVDAVISLAGAIIMKDWRLYILPVARYVFKYQHKSKGPDICSTSAKSQAVTYPKYPLAALEQFLSLIEHVREELPSVKAPALIVHSQRDHTITYDNLEYISTHLGSDTVRTLSLEESYHVISVDIERNRIFAEVEDFFEQCKGMERKGTGRS